MDKLSNGQIDTDTAKAQAGLAKQANNALKYELDRTKLELELNSSKGLVDKNLSIREIEINNPV